MQYLKRKNSFSKTNPINYQPLTQLTDQQTLLNSSITNFLPDDDSLSTNSDEISSASTFQDKLDSNFSNSIITLQDLSKNNKSSNPYLINNSSNENAINSNYNPCKNLTKNNKSSNKNLNSNQRRLIIAVSICFTFFVVELLGGLQTHSLALVADSFHLLTDCAAYLVSLLAIYIGQKPANKKYSWGYARAEVLGAMISVVLIWILTFFLVLEAIERLNNPGKLVDGKEMLCFALFGLFCNILLLTTLGHDHDHSNHHKDIETKAGCEEDSLENQTSLPNSSKSKNINVRAAIIHALGDLLCSIGVLTSSIFIMIDPSWQILDPLCTFLFAFIVLCTTFNIIRDVLKTLMEATPSHLKSENYITQIEALEGVIKVEDIHIWSLTTEKTIVLLHVKITSQLDSCLFKRNKILADIKHIFSSDNFFHSTVEISSY